MKKFFFLISLFFFLIPQLFAKPASEHRGLFVSVIQEPQTLSSKKEIKELVRFSKDAGIDALFVQIYRANKAWFPSKVADETPYRDCVKRIGGDPFLLLIKEAHAAGIEVHAWLNLLSLSANDQAPLLKKYGPSILTQKLGEKNTLEDYKIDSQYFLEPGDSRVRKELKTIIREILTAYPQLDGLQLDYIRYPDSKPFYGYTKENILNFKEETGEARVEEGNPKWKKWRRDQVTRLVKELAQTARALRPAVQVSTTGCAPYSRAFHEAFQDWAFWLDSGLVDFVTMMSYPADVKSFQDYIAGVKNKPRDFHRVNVAVPAYKQLASPAVLREQMAVCEKSGSRGCVVFHYGSLLENPELKKNLFNGSEKI